MEQKDRAGGIMQKETQQTDKYMSCQALKKALRDSGHVVHFNLVGGGFAFANEFGMSGGLSRVLSGINMPYSVESQNKLAPRPDKYVTKQYAYDLSCQKYGNETLTVSLTVQLAKENEREGRQHIGYLCIRDWRENRVSEHTIHPRGKNTTDGKIAVLSGTLRENQEIELTTEIQDILLNYLRDFGHSKIDIPAEVSQSDEPEVVEKNPHIDEGVKQWVGGKPSLQTLGESKVAPASQETVDDVNNWLSEDRHTDEMHNPSTRLCEPFDLETVELEGGDLDDVWQDESDPAKITERENDENS